MSRMSSSLGEHIPREVFPMLKEIQQQPAIDKKREEAELKVLLTSLSERIKPTPGPHIPATVWKEACSCEREEWPNLRARKGDTRIPNLSSRTRPLSFHVLKCSRITV